MPRLGLATEQDWANLNTSDDSAICALGDRVLFDVVVPRHASQPPDHFRRPAARAAAAAAPAAAPVGEPSGSPYSSRRAACGGRACLLPPRPRLPPATAGGHAQPATCGLAVLRAHRARAGQRARGRRDAHQRPSRGSAAARGAHGEWCEWRDRPYMLQLIVIYLLALCGPPAPPRPAGVLSSAWGDRCSTWAHGSRACAPNPRTPLLQTGVRLCRLE